MVLNVAIPVFNEAGKLERSLRALCEFLAKSPVVEWEIVIADNGSTDCTWEIARTLESGGGRIKAVHLDQKGRGRALKRVWSRSEAEVLMYMDVDLSTDLGALPALVEAVALGKHDLAVGSRLHPESVTVRCWKRELISRAYNRLVRMVFGTRFTDAQCGFKAITRQAARELLPLVEDNGWFFDTELLVLAEKLGYRIFDLPVKWTEDPDSRVRIASTALGDLRGIWRLRRRLKAGRSVGCEQWTVGGERKSLGGG